MTVDAPAPETTLFDIYVVGAFGVGWLSGIATFIGAWVAAIGSFGFLIGVGLGWIPAIFCGLIVGVAAGLLWPLLLVGVLMLFANMP